MALIEVTGRAYGARPDDTRNDTVAIQRAIDAARPGDTVHLAAGTYIVSGDGTASHGALRLATGITLAGDGMGETILKLADGYDAKLTGIVRTPSGASKIANVTVRDLTIDGNKDHTSGEVDGFYAGASPGTDGLHKAITLDRVEIDNASRYGFDPHERTVGLVIRDCVAHDNGKDGFVVDWVRDALLIGNVSYDNGRHGFNIVTSAADVTLIGNEAHGNGVDPFVVQQGSDLGIPPTSDVHFHDNVLSGDSAGVLRIRYSADVLATGNEDGHGKPALLAAAYSSDVVAAVPAGHPGSTPPVIGTTGKDGLAGAAGDDLLLGMNGSDTLTGRNGLDFLAGGSGDDFIYGGSGNDLLTGGSGADHINAGTGDDLVEGGRGNDLVTGRDGNDTLLGGSGRDNLLGQNGNDVILGGTGADTLTGGAGIDRFVYAAADEGGTGEVIRDFTVGPHGDVLVIGGWLQGFTADHEADYLSVQHEDKGTLLLVDWDGTGHQAAPSALVLLLDRDVDLAALISGHQFVAVPDDGLLA